MLEFQCPHCNEILSIPEQFIGSKGTCRKCKSTITIEPQSTHDAEKEFNAYGELKNPTLVILHCETTGPSSRKNNLIEVAAIKFDLNVQELDTYWSFCNPDQLIPEKIVERTGITDDMVAQAPFPYEVLKELFDWTGPHTLFLCDHAHFHSKFLTAALYQEDIEPPECQILDVTKWARQLNVAAQEYKLRSLLESIGNPLSRDQHRALNTCQGIRVLVAHLMEKQETADGFHHDTTMIGKLAHRKEQPKKEKAIYNALLTMSSPVTEMYGENFHAHEGYLARKSHTSNCNGEKRSPTPLPFLMHMPEWYEEKKRLIETAVHHPEMAGIEGLRSHEEDTPWEFALMEASQSHDADEQRQHWLEAVSLGARDPMPYEKLTGFYIKAQDYKSAQRVCERFFETEGWKNPQNGHLSLKLLERLHKLERRLSQTA